MKKCLTLLIATVLSGISLTAYAAQPMSNLDSGQLRPAGTVSATGASNLSDLEDKLAEKAREQGAKGYVINSAGGNDPGRWILNASQRVSWADSFFCSSLMMYFLSKFLPV